MAYPATFGAGLFVVAEFPRTVRCSCCCVFCLFCSCFLGFLPMQENMIAVFAKICFPSGFTVFVSCRETSNNNGIFCVPSPYKSLKKVVKRKEGCKLGQKRSAERVYTKQIDLREYICVCVLVWLHLFSLIRFQSCCEPLASCPSLRSLACCNLPLACH